MEYKESKYDKMCLWLSKDIKRVLLLCVATCLLPSLAVIIRNMNPLPNIVIGFLSFLFFPIGYAMATFVIGFHVWNPFVSNTSRGLISLYSICHAFFFFFGFGGLMFTIFLPIDFFTTDTPSDVVFINIAPLSVGFVYKCAKIHVEHVLNRSVTT
ncbi:MAG: hypothetical protein ACFFCW_46955 [Candidatus Hodarchaeota archaeon]